MSKRGDDNGPTAGAASSDATAGDRSWPAGRRLAPPEPAVLEGVRRRDPDALGVFFEHYFDAIYGLAYRSLGNRQQAEDTTQEVFLKLHRAAPRLDPERDPAPWIMTITLNACRSIHRSGAQRMQTHAVMMNGSTDHHAELTDPAPSPEQRQVSREEERLVHQALGELPESLREVVLLRDYQGLTHKEVAQALELNHDAVRKRYSRALTELAALLKDKV